MDGDFEVVVKVVSLAVFADIELVGDGLAARRSRQRVQFPRNGVGRIELYCVRFPLMTALSFDHQSQTSDRHYRLTPV